MRFLTLLLTLLLPIELLANCPIECEIDRDWALEVRGAYYQHFSRMLRKVYRTGWIDYQVEASNRVSNFVEFWTGVYWTNKQRGHAQSSYKGFKNQTKIFILPLNIGFKLIYPLLPFADAYVGAGICYSFLTIKNHCRENFCCWELTQSPFKHVIHKNGVGAVFKSGFKYDLGGHVFLDIFVDYFSQYFRLSRHKRELAHGIFKRHLDCSGFKFGAGLGVYF